MNRSIPSLRKMLVRWALVAGILLPLALASAVQAAQPAGLPAFGGSEKPVNHRTAWSFAESQATPTPVPAPGNPNPRNSGELFFPADFTAFQHWYSFSLPEDQPYTVGLDRGVLYLQAPGTFENVYVFYEMPLVASDVRLEAVVENRSDVTANNISLLCRANKEGWYEFSINSGGFWHIWKLADGQYSELATGPSRVINQKRGQNAITATCIGSDLTLYVNYRKIGSAQDRTFQDGGQVGVGLSSFGLKGAAVDFDHFSASLP